MGMYTSIVISARLKPSTSDAIIETISHLLNGHIHIKDVLGDEALRNPLDGTSAIFPESASSLQPTKHPDGHTLNVVSHIKNYHSEIEGFIKWLRPHVESGHGACEWWAIVTYEEAERPTIYYLEDPDA